VNRTPTRVFVRRQSAGFIGLVWQPRFPGARRCVTLHETDPETTADDAAIRARSWSKTHGLTVEYTSFEAGLRGPGLVGECTIESEP
jgi:hypothetical protein